MKMAWKIMVLVAVLGASAAQAAPKAALFVQNRAGAQLEGQLDALIERLQQEDRADALARLAQAT